MNIAEDLLKELSGKIDGLDVTNEQLLVTIDNMGVKEELMPVIDAVCLISTGNRISDMSFSEFDTTFCQKEITPMAWIGALIAYIAHQKIKAVASGKDTESSERLKEVMHELDDLRNLLN